MQLVMCTVDVSCVISRCKSRSDSYPKALKGCRDIVFTHGVQMGGKLGGRAVSRKGFSGLYHRNRKA